MADKQNFLTYKGLPLVRCGDVLYYGNMSDKYVIRLTVLDCAVEKDIKTAKKVKIELLLSDTSIDEGKRIIKSSEKGGLYDAMDVGAIWLSRKLQK